MYYQVSAKNNANYTNTTMMDLVFTFDKEANDNIKGISARNWFSEKEKYFNDYGINNKFKVISHEVVPGTFVENTKVRLSKEPISLILFFNYFNNTENRVILNNVDDLEIRILLNYDNHKIIIESNNYKNSNSNNNNSYLNKENFDKINDSVNDNFSSNSNNSKFIDIFSN
ncbi:hypothetical protein ACWNT8_13325 [Pigmentibacter ruber]|nr:hypothetical protein GTC16762_13420 [Pigmentibacter ruber]